GSMQRYLALMLAAMLLVGFAVFHGSSHALGERVLVPATPVAVVGWILLMGSCAAVVVMHQRRLQALVVVGVIGLIVSIGFVYLSAPDLALTQISVEVVTVILMLLALNFLPKRSPRESAAPRRWRDALLALAAGGGVGGAAWAVLTRDAETLSGYYLEQAVPGGGGTNVVNVILVDFRGFDTFGEIIVLGIAALAIFALLDGLMTSAAGHRLQAWQPDQARAADRHPMMLAVATRVMLPLALMVGFYVFLRGHNVPGGGFIAGLVVAVALIVQYMASGFGWAAQRMKVDYHALIGVGVLIAAATGLGSLVVGYPFLTSTAWHLDLPLLGELHIASAMFFDTGVFLVVVGATMLALANLSRVGRHAEHLLVNREPMDVDPSRVMPATGEH
ncbi:MAG: monovalent cation/H+ antiporter subunit A, partial [Betaproteobacteria bacterium HGW-Betaproteobacteria-13]